MTDTDREPKWQLFPGSAFIEAVALLLESRADAVASFHSEDEKWVKRIDAFLDLWDWEPEVD